jgi:hypothetical protein
MSKIDFFAFVYELFDIVNVCFIMQLFAESGLEPPTFELPMQGYNHYTNSGDEINSQRDQQFSAYLHIVMVTTHHEQNRFLNYSILRTFALLHNCLPRVGLNHLP